MARGYDAARSRPGPAMRLATCLFAATLLAGCASPSMKAAGLAPADAPLEFVVLRHAEKATGAGDDPPLVAAGHARAAAIAALLADAPVTAVYSTAYARTRETAMPTAAAHALPVTPYDARQPADALAAMLRATHAGGTVVVVGHSNTVPEIASALCGCEVAAMDETEYDRLLRVRIPPRGPATLVVERQPGPAAP